MSVLKDENGRESLKRIWANRSYWIAMILSIIMFFMGWFFVAKSESLIIYAVGFVLSIGGVGVAGSVLEKFRKKENTE